MADDLSAELDLSIERALSSVDELRTQIDRATQESADQFEEDFARAISGVPDVQIVADTADVEPAITTAIVDTDSTVVLDPDAEAVAPAIETSISTADPTLAIEPNADAVAPAIDAAIGSVDPTITVDADTSAAVAEMAAAGEGVTATMSVDADTAPALAEIQDVVTQTSGQSVDLTVNVDTSQAVQSTEDLSASSSDAGDSMDAASVAGQGLGAATSLTSGSLDTMTNAVGSSLGKLGPWGAALAGSVVALGGFTNSAVNSLGAVQRLENTFGTFQGQIEHIQIGNLDTSLKQLALDTGSSGSAMRNAASDSFQMVSSFGVGKEAATQYSAQVQALAARAVALNPALGETGQVAEQLNSAFRSGRDKALVPYQLGITASAIAARAATIAHGEFRTEITQADKAMAGAQLATEKLGGHLKQDIAEGTKDPILQVRTLTKEFTSATTEIGKPLVAPMLDALHQALPSVEAVGKAIGSLATAALPALTAALQLVAPVLQVLADVMSAIPGPALIAGAALLFVGQQVSDMRKKMVEAGTTGDELGKTGASLGQKIALAAVGISTAVVAIKQITDGSGDATQGIMGMAAAGATLGGIAGPEGAAIGAVAGAIAGLTINAIAGGESVDHYRQKFADLGKEIEGLGAKAAAAQFVKKLGMEDFIKLAAGGATAVKGISDELTALGTSSPGAVKNVLDGLKAMRDESGKPLFTGAEFDKLVAAADKGTAAYQRHKQKAAEAQAENDAFASGAATTAGAVANAATVVDSFGHSFDLTKQQTDASTQAVKAHADAVYQMQGATQSATLATQAQAAVDALAVQHSAALALASRDVAAAHGAVATELITTADTFANAQAAEQRYNDGLGTAKEATDALRDASGLLGSELDRLLGRFLTADQSTNNFELALLDMGNQLFANGFAFDENSKAGLTNQNMIDDLGSKAIAASKALFDSGVTLTEAKKPLEDFRGSIVKLRDDMTTAGNTAGAEFATKTLAGVDAAIAGLGADAGPFGAAALGLGQAGAAGGMLAQADWVRLGAYLSGQAVTAATFTGADWTALGNYLAGQGATALSDAQNTANYYAGGHALGLFGATGQGDAVQNWINTANDNTGAAVTAVNNKQGDIRGAGKGAGDVTAAGLHQGMGVIPGNANAAVNDAAGQIIIAGVSVSIIAVQSGIGIGAALVGGITAGIDDNAGSISASLNAAIHNAVEKAHGSGPPYEAGRDVIGVPLATGISDGITQTMQPIDLGPMLHGSHHALARAGGSSGSGSTAIAFNISVNGVSDPTMARTVGEQVGEGAASALARRGVIVRARTG